MDFFLLERRKIIWLDNLRAVAVLLVICRHVLDRPFANLPHAPLDSTLGKALELLFSFGWSGVHLFFIISGYLVGGSIVRSIAQEKFVWKIFFVNRGFRIGIPAIVLTILWLFRRGEKDVLIILTNIFMVTNYTGNAVLGHYWSLCVEEHFYIFCPLVCFLFASQIRRSNLEVLGSRLLLLALGFSLFRIAMIALPVYDFLLPGSTPATGKGLLNLLITPKGIYPLSHWQLDFFLIGISLNLLQDKLRLTHLLPLAFAVLSYFATSFYLAHVDGNTAIVNQSDPFSLAVALTMCGIVMGILMVHASSCPNFYRSRILRYIAAISYSAYLVHLPLLELGEPLFSFINNILQDMPILCLLAMIFVGIAGSLALGVFFFALVEKPSLTLRDWVVPRLSLKRTVSAPEPT